MKLKDLLDKDLRVDFRILSVRYQYRRFLLHPYQRVRYGYSDRDLYSFDHFLERVMVRGLRELATCPAYKPIDENYESDPDAGPEHWQRLLHEMADGFEISAEKDTWEMTEEEKKQVKRSYKLLAKFHEGLWW